MLSIILMGFLLYLACFGNLSEDFCIVSFVILLFLAIIEVVGELHIMEAYIKCAG